MSIWKMCQAYLQEQRQKGQIIVFTAVLLPFIIAMCGLTVDFGNMYVHKSRLQNAADAAAIAGAYAYADSKESPSGHPKADAAADKSINTNHPNFSNLTMEYKARRPNNADDKAYFRVVLTEEVPVYFLRFFNVGDTAKVDAEAVAAIETSSGGGTTGGGNSIFSNLFSFGEGGFTSTNNGQNPDNPNNSINYNNVATYDGNIVNVGPTAGTTQYRHVLLTSKTREEVKNGNITTTQDAINKQKAGDPGYYTTVTTDKTKSLDEQLEAIKTKALDKDTGTTIEWQNGVYLSNYLALANGKNYICNNSTNFELKIDEDYYKNNKNNNDPLYIVVNTKDSGCKITPQAKYQKEYETSRPIVIVYTGPGEVTIDPTGNGFFRGIIYAPNGTVKINDNKLTFKGSIAAKTISLGSVGYYSWEAIIPGTSDAGSGSSGTGTTSIGLVSPPSNISWN